MQKTISLSGLSLDTDTFIEEGSLYLFVVVVWFGFVLLLSGLVLGHVLFYFLPVQALSHIFRIICFLFMKAFMGKYT